MSGIVGGLNKRGSGLILSSATDGQVLTATGAGMSAGFEAAEGGTISQVLQKQLTEVGSFSVSTHTWTDVTGASLAITPSSASSKILITGNIGLGHNGYGGVRILRGSTAVGVPTDSIGDRPGCNVGSLISDSGSSYEIFTYPIHWIDSPATTSATTYKVQFHYHTGTTIYINRENSDSDHGNRTRAVTTLTLTELSSATIS